MDWWHHHSSYGSSSHPLHEAILRITLFPFQFLADSAALKVQQLPLACAKPRSEQETDEWDEFLGPAPRRDYHMRAPLGIFGGSFADALSTGATMGNDEEEEWRDEVAGAEAEMRIRARQGERLLAVDLAVANAHAAAAQAQVAEAEKVRWPAHKAQSLVAAATARAVAISATQAVERRPDALTADGERVEALLYQRQYSWLANEERALAHVDAETNETDSYSSARGSPDSYASSSAHASPEPRIGGRAMDNGHGRVEWRPLARFSSLRRQRSSLKGANANTVGSSPKPKAAAGKPSRLWSAARLLPMPRTRRSLFGSARFCSEA